MGDSQTELFRRIRCALANFIGTHVVLSNRWILFGTWFRLVPLLLTNIHMYLDILTQLYCYTCIKLVSRIPVTRAETRPLVSMQSRSDSFAGTVHSTTDTLHDQAKDASGPKRNEPQSIPK